jgi:phosphatidylinositol-3-phosphatase
VFSGCPSKKLRVCLPLVGFLFVAGVSLESGCGGGGSPAAAAKSASIPQVSHVVLLIEENHSFASVIGNPGMPYTNSLAQKYALATQYYAVTHPSLPNYFMLTVGVTTAVDDSFAGTVTSDNVVRALTAAGRSWKIYAESLPGPGYLGPTSVPYVKDHNPFAYFSDVVASTVQAGNMVPFSQLALDLKNGTLPNYAMIVPDLANDGHDCPNLAPSCTDAQKLATVDSWIQSNVGPLISDPAFQNSVLIYTWDEADITDVTNGGGRVATILAGPKVRTGYQSTTLYQHQSTLKLTLQLLGVSDYPGAAAAAPDMAEFF